MKQLSIIVPVYNVGAYLERCLRSLGDQDISKDLYEIICINDGSTDNSRDIIISMRSEYGNIILMDQENKGVSAARNRGIENAIGEYVLMIDGDDYIKPRVLGKRLSVLQEVCPEMAYTGHIFLDENSAEVYRFDPLFENGKVLSGIEFVNSFLRTNKEISSPHSSVSILIKRSFLEKNNLRYLEGVPYLEDGQFMAKLNCLSKSVILINDPIYVITRRPGSAVNSNLYFTESARNGFLKAANDLVFFRDGELISAEQKIFLNNSIAHFVFVYLISNSQVSYLRNYTKIKKSLKNGPLGKLKLEGCSSAYSNLGRFYNISVHLFYLYWLFYKIQLSLTRKTVRMFKKIRNE